MKHILIMLLIYKATQTQLTSALLIHSKTSHYIDKRNKGKPSPLTPPSKHHEGSRG